jgi:PAS domain-containing protein
MASTWRIETEQQVAPQITGGALELVWPLTFTAVFVAVFVTWYQRLIDIDVERITWLLAFGTAGHLLIPTGGESTLRSALRFGSHLTGILILGAAWALLGGLSAPLFLLFFAPPIAAAGVAFGPWSRLGAMALSLTTIFLTAAVCSAPLRWYLGQVGIRLEWLDPLAARLAIYAGQAGESVEPTSAAVSLLLAAAALLCLEFGAHGYSNSAGRLFIRLRTIVRALRQREGMALEILRSSPLPETVVLTESAQIVIANDKFRSSFASTAEPEGADLFSVVKLQFPEALATLVRERDGELACSFNTADGRTHSARIQVRHARHGRALVARISFFERDFERQLEYALDAVDAAILILNTSEVVVYANALARSLFPEAQPGATATAGLQSAGVPGFWWQAARDTSVPRQLTVKGKQLRGKVTSRGADRFGDAVTIIALAPQAVQ